MVVAKAWGLPRPSRRPPAVIVAERGTPGSDSTDDAAVVQNQDLEHQRETYVSNKGVKVPPPKVDSPAGRVTDKEKSESPGDS